MNRREFVQLGLASPLVAAQAQKPAVAAITTAFFFRSHSDDIVTRELEGYWIGESFYPPPVRIASLYQDQTSLADIGQKLARAFHVPIKQSIAEALTLGSGKLAVDGVILIAEHGDYPFNDKQQQLYPRYEFFSQIVDVFRSSNRAVPVYTDKHLSYDWTKARQMYDWSREFKFPLMAGSSVSVTFRRPELDPPRNAPLVSALALGSGWTSDGGIFHNLEVLQCFAKRRRGGESGIRAVQHLQGDAVWQAAEQGLWSKDLLRAALARAERPGPGRPEDAKNPVLCLLDYNDGFRGAALMLPGIVNEYLAAIQLEGQPPQGTLLYVPPENSNNFSQLVHGMNQMFTSGKPPYPVERTLLTSGALSFLMDSAAASHRRIETPMLNIIYQAPAQSWYSHGQGS